MCIRDRLHEELEVDVRRLGVGTGLVADAAAARDDVDAHLCCEKPTKAAGVPTGVLLGNTASSLSTRDGIGRATVAPSLPRSGGAAAVASVPSAEARRGDRGRATTPPGPRPAGPDAPATAAGPDDSTTTPRVDTKDAAACRAQQATELGDTKETPGDG